MQRLNGNSLYKVVALMVLMLFVVSKPMAKETQPAKREMYEGYWLVDWTELMPKEDLEALLSPPESLNNIEDGSEEDMIASQVMGSIEQANDSRYQQALSSTRVIDKLDGELIRLPGFVVPLEFNKDQKVTQFFLVPYFGACIHVPPPPPNQIVFVEYKEGFKLESLNQPVWVSGVLNTKLVQNQTATAAYAIKVERLELYKE